ncbi:acetylornithine deacetylase/succinyl-diaminopimelate desuccinylase-like protein [Silvibacterium bohemicum]|uniref:Acetylornithine deacetylase/succinyl-diaminopimelate desuccinylase-like protein n=1 Tax=Silvibacterium bohemicum TaxID=1577686 RepID=A0A841JQG9_9BACT|nr:dipeptidase [Silvibacterium bohemicum]MBB6143576.1 acetylornithine deacetylase/succinyl-diaminopimelate desuccinylase-like protein [Silvibacterium bohemicum]
MEPHRALVYARKHRPRFLAELKEFLRLPSVSSQPARKKDVAGCAAWLAAHLRRVGLDRVHVIPTQGNPIVYGSRQRGAGYPTLLIYGHYDVLPGEPLGEWKTQPFAPTVRGNRLYARGASDDKGQLFCHIKAIESFLAAEGKLPINVKCLFEGEEEIGSPHLFSFIARNKNALRADAAIISDTRMIAQGRPAISYAQRGGLRAEITIEGPEHELHSGSFGGAVHNPLQVLCEMVAGLHDERGRVTIPGFYDDVVAWSEKERRFMRRSGPSDEKIRQEAGVEGSWGEAGHTLYERITTRPALTVNGIAGGHSGHGHKAIIPSRAVAKLSFRLVPNQDPSKIGKLFRDHIAEVTPVTVRSSVRVQSPIRPALMNRNDPAMQTAAFAYKKGFGTSPLFLRSGGSIPVINSFQDELGVPVVLMGFGLPGDNIHAPNESFHLPTFFRAIDTCIWHLAAFAHRSPDQRSRPSERIRERIAL